MMQITKNHNTSTPVRVIFIDFMYYPFRTAENKWRRMGIPYMRERNTPVVLNAQETPSKIKLPKYLLTNLKG